MTKEKKYCPTCLKSKIVESFYKDVTRKDNLSRECRRCTKERVRKAGLKYAEKEPLTHKVCYWCKEDKPAADFYRHKSKKGGLASRCKECHNLRERIRHAVSSIEARDHIRKAKDVPCTDCHQRYPYYVMDFDHVRGEKHHTLAHMSRKGMNWTLDVINDEIAKCEVVCSNCHRARTYHRQVNRQQKDFESLASRRDGSNPILEESPATSD